MFNKKIFSIRFHGYGGQGVKSMASILATSAIQNDMFAQAFPEFGPERRGAPVKAYARFSLNPILSRSSIKKPDLVVVMNENLLNLDDVREGTGVRTIFLVNTTLFPNELKQKYSLIPEYRLIHCINLPDRLIDFDNKVHPSIPVLGEIIKITGIAPIEEVKLVLRQEFLKKIGEEKTKATEKALEESYYNF